MIQRSATLFSGRSASSSSSGTRPTSTRQTWATTSRPTTGTETVSGSPSSPVTSARRDAVGIGVDPVLVLPAGAVDALAEVAVAVHQPDRDERERAVGGLLEDVAGEHAEAAGVDRQRAVDGVLRAEEGDGALRRHAGGRDRLGAPSVATGALEASTRSRKPLVLGELLPAGRDAPPAAAGPGCRATAPSASGRSTRTAPGRPGSRTSGSCRRSPRAAPSGSGSRERSATAAARRSEDACVGQDGASVIAPMKAGVGSGLRVDGHMPVTDGRERLPMPSRPSGARSAIPAEAGHQVELGRPGVAELDAARSRPGRRRR